MEKNKKIFLVSVMENWGGGEEFLLKLIQNIPDFNFVLLSPEGRALDKLKKSGVRFYIINSLKKIYRVSGKWGINSYIKILVNIKVTTFRLIWFYKKENPDIILANGLFAALYVLPSVILTRKKLIVVQHLIFNNRSIETRVLKIIIKYAEKIISVSNAVRENVVEMLGSDSEKIIVIPNGVDIPDEELIKEKNDDKIIFGIVGSIIRIKGIHLVIEAMKDILKKDNIYLHIFGSHADDPDSIKYEKELKERIVELKLSDKIIFKGYVDKKEEIYNNIDFVINYSTIPEAFPFSVIEAMSYGKVVIAANIGGPKEIIEDEKDGFLVEPNNIKSLKDKIEFCIENVGNFYRMKEEARKIINEKYSIEIFSKKYYKIFAEIIS